MTQPEPEALAERVARVRTVAERLIWVGIAVGLAFTMINVQVFAAHHTPTYSLTWWAAWLLDPAVTVILLGVLITEGVTSRRQIVMGVWARVAKWSLLAATYVMNTWQAWESHWWAGVVLHSVPPLAVFVGAEARTDIQDKLTECLHPTHRSTGETSTQPGGTKGAPATTEPEGEGLPQGVTIHDIPSGQRRVSSVTEPTPRPAGRTGRPTRGPEPLRSPGGDRPATVRTVTDRPGGLPRRSGPDAGTLLVVGRAVAEHLAGQGRSLTRSALLTGLRAQGVSCSTDRASALLTQLRTPTATGAPTEAPAGSPSPDRTRTDASDRPRLAVGGDR